MASRRSSVAPVDTEAFTYKWTGAYGAVIDGHTTPAGSSVVVEPGEEFQSTTAIDVITCPSADPVSANAVTAAEELVGAAAEADEHTEATGDEAPSQDEATTGDTPAVTDPEA